MIDCYLVRHADAGSRGIQNDHQRRLSKRGRAQAGRLVDPFRTVGLTQLLSSPFARCMETLAPLATALDLPVEADLHLQRSNGSHVRRNAQVAVADWPRGLALRSSMRRWKLS